MPYSEGGLSDGAALPVIPALTRTPAPRRSPAPWPCPPPKADGTLDVFFEETSLVGRDERRLEFPLLKRRLLKRLEFHGIELPVELRIRRPDFRRVRRASIILRLRLEPPRQDVAEMPDEQRSAGGGKAVMQLTCILAFADCDGFAGEYRARIQARLHLHQAHPGLLVPGEDRGLDRGGPAPAR